MNPYEPLYRLADYLSTGGPVMVPLAIDSLVLWVLIMDRALFFRRLYIKNMDLKTAVEHIRSNRMPDPAKYRGVVSMLVARFLSRRSGVTSIDRLIVDETVSGISHILSSHLSLLGVLAAVAPLLGLLGTVLGMITTFDVLAVHGTGNARAVAGGISEALVTTQTGLMVAIPGMYMKSILDRRAGILKQRVAAAGFYIKRHLGGEEPGEMKAKGAFVKEGASC